MDVHRRGFWPTLALFLSAVGCSSAVDSGAGGGASDPLGKTAEVGEAVGVPIDAAAAVCGLAEGTACTPAGVAPKCCASGRVCGNNGVKNDVCCESQVGQNCYSADGCCEGLSCVGGTCQLPVCGLAEGTACMPAGLAPSCCASGRVCGNNGVKNDVCCESQAGQNCYSLDGCCEGLSCIGGTCRAAVCGLAEGTACMPAGLAPNCCASGRVCGNNGVKNGVCCESKAGQNCYSVDGCCAGLLCESGVCKAPVAR